MFDQTTFNRQNNKRMSSNSEILVVDSFATCQRVGNFLVALSCPHYFGKSSEIRDAEIIIIIITSSGSIIIIGFDPVLIPWVGVFKMLHILSLMLEVKKPPAANLVLSWPLLRTDHRTTTMVFSRKPTKDSIIIATKLKTAPQTY